MCDGKCSRSYHQNCLKIDDPPEDEGWLCPICDPNSFPRFTSQQRQKSKLLNQENDKITTSKSKDATTKHKDNNKSQARTKQAMQKAFSKKAKLITKKTSYSKPSHNNTSSQSPSFNSSPISHKRSLSVSPSPLNRPLKSARSIVQPSTTDMINTSASVTATIDYERKKWNWKILKPVQSFIIKNQSFLNTDVESHSLTEISKFRTQLIEILEKLFNSLVQPYEAAKTA